MTIEAGIYAHLIADSGVADLVATRIYPLLVPQDATLPAMAYQRISGPRDHSHSGPSGLVTARMQLTYVALSYDGAKSLGEVVRAAMDGFRVMPIAEAAEIGDLFVTLTGDTSVIRPEHFGAMKDGAIVANSGHFNVELDLDGLAAMADGPPRAVREFVEEYRIRGTRVFVLGQGRLINLAAAEGHPASVMDMSFANQALASEYLKKEVAGFERRVYRVPEEIDREIAALKLNGMGIRIDVLTAEQEEYLSSWHLGT